MLYNRGSIVNLSAKGMLLQWDKTNYRRRSMVQKTLRFWFTVTETCDLQSLRHVIPGHDMMMMTMMMTMMMMTMMMVVMMQCLLNASCITEDAAAVKK